MGIIYFEIKEKEKKRIRRLRPMTISHAKKATHWVQGESAGRRGHALNPRKEAGKSPSLRLLVQILLTCHILQKRRIAT